MSDLSPREELASIAASLRAYLEWQTDCGSSGIPRRPRDPGAKSIATATAAVTAPATVIPSTPVVPPEPVISQRAAPSSLLKDPNPPSSLAIPSSFGVPAAPASVSGSLSVATPSSASQNPMSSVAPPVPPSIVTPRPLPVLMEDVKGCVKCGLATTRTNTVFARGNPAAKLCFVGEAPGADEDAQGVPFVGRAGQLLDRMIQAMGLDPAKDVYVCNIIKCRPPGNRRPEPEEIATCIPYLHEQLAHVDPKAIVALGNTAVGALLGTKLGITKVRGAWKLYRGKIPVMPTYHPSYLLRPGPTQSEAKRQAWEDLQTVMKELGLERPARS